MRCASSGRSTLCVGKGATKPLQGFNFSQCNGPPVSALSCSRWWCLDKTNLLDPWRVKPWVRLIGEANHPTNQLWVWPTFHLFLLKYSLNKKHLLHIIDTRVLDIHGDSRKRFAQNRHMYHDLSWSYHSPSRTVCMHCVSFCKGIGALRVTSMLATRRDGSCKLWEWASWEWRQAHKVSTLVVCWHVDHA